MTNNDFINHLAKTMQLDNKQTAKLVSGLTDVLAENAMLLNNIAFPGFGTFVSEKVDEHVQTSADGKRTFVPPSINVSFKEGSRFRKAVNNPKQS